MSELSWVKDFLHILHLKGFRSKMGKLKKIRNTYFCNSQLELMFFNKWNVLTGIGFDALYQKEIIEVLSDNPSKYRLW